MVEIGKAIGRAVSERPRGGARTDYGHSRSVEKVAAVTAARYEPETLSEMKRLAAFLASGEMFRNDVPRGYYFNALV